MQGIFLSFMLSTASHLVPGIKGMVSLVVKQVQLKSFLGLILPILRLRIGH